MEKYDVILAGGMDYIKPEPIGYLVGQTILAKVLNQSYSTKHIYFDYLNTTGKLVYELDVEKTYEKLADYILDFEPKVVGFHTMANSFSCIVVIAELIHKKASNVKIFFGGPHATVTAKDCLQTFPWLSVVCRGESEKIITPLVKALIEGTSLLDVPQISFIDNGEVVSNPDTTLLTNEELKNYSLVDVDNNFNKDTHIFLEGGRGCPFSCAFCSTKSFWGRCFRIKPVQDLIEEMDAYNERYGSYLFNINHDNFTTNKNHILEFCDALKAKNNPYYWTCSSRIDVIDKETIEHMAAAGCKSIYFGIETGSQRMQKLVDKNIDLSQVFEKLDIVKKNNINFITSFIYGFADETEEDFDETLAMLEKIYIRYSEKVQLHLYFLLPATAETDKVYDKAYFDIKDNCCEMTLNDTITQKSIELIKTHKSLFIQNYNFHSPVRDKYRDMTHLVTFFVYMKKRYPITCERLVRKYGFKKIFLQNEKIVQEMGKDYALIEKLNLTYSYWTKHLYKIVEAYDDFNTKELFKAEKDIVDFFSKKEHAEPFIREYDIDVKQALTYSVFIKRHAKYEFKIEDGKKMIREI